MNPQNDAQPAPPLLTALLEYAGIATWYWHVDEDRFECCPKCHHYLALPEGALPRIEHVFSALHPNDKPGLERQITALIENQIQHFQQDIRLLQPDGTIRWSSVYVIREMRDHALIVAGLLEDITEHKQQAIELRNDLTLFKSIYERAMIGIGIADTEGNIKRCNSEFTKMVGYSETELQNMHYSVLIYPEDEGPNVSQFDRIIQGEIDKFTIKNRYRHKDGSPIWVDKRISTLLDDAGLPKHTLALVSDISASKAMEDELNESRHLFEQALTGSELGIWDMDIETEKMHYDARYLAMLGYDEHELKPTLAGWKQLIHPDDLLVVLDAIRAHLTGETRLYETEHRLRHKQGHWVWVQAKGKVLYDDHGRPIRATGTQLDITDRKRIATEGAALLHKIEALIKGLERKPSAPDRAPDDASESTARLTLRNQQVLALLAEGLTATQIAERLGISYETVVTHRRTLMNKLGLKNKAELIRYALKHDIGMPLLR